MITLYGISLSNYYNKIKLALLEKGIDFKEEATVPSQDPDMLPRSPLGKIPYIKTDQGYLSESQAIFEYLEDAHPDNPLYPSDPFERAKCRELILHLELNMELILRRLYGEVFFATPVSDETKQEVKGKVESGLNGVNRLAAFSPYALGSTFSAADIVIWIHLGMVSLVTQKVYGEDFVTKFVPAAAEYFRIIESRPHVQRCAQDRDAAVKTFMEKQ